MQKQNTHLTAFFILLSGLSQAHVAYARVKHEVPTAPVPTQAIIIESDDEEAPEGVSPWRDSQVPESLKVPPPPPAYYPPGVAAAPAPSFAPPPAAPPRPHELRPSKASEGKEAMADTEHAVENVLDHVANKVDPVMRIVDDTKAIVDTAHGIVQVLNSALDGTATLASHPISVLPPAADSWQQLYGWNRVTSKKIFKVEYTMPDGNKITLQYRISSETGGSFNGHGHYIGSLQVQERKIDVPSLYNVEATVVANDPVNVGSDPENPVAKVSLELKISLKYTATTLGFFTSRPAVNIQSAFFTITGDQGISLVDDPTTEP